MAIAHAFTTAISSTATTTSYSGALSVSSASNLLLVFLSGYKSNNADVPSSTMTVTYGGVAMTLVQESNNTSTGDWAAIFRLDSPPTGSNTLAVTGPSFRSFSAIADEVSGHDTTTPIAGNGTVRSSGTMTSQSFARTTVANNNHLVSGAVLRSAAATPDPTVVAGEVTATGGATLTNAGATGTNGNNDHAFACAWEEVATAGADGHGYAWVSGVRPDIVWVEINVATGGGTITVPVDPATITLTGQDIAVSISGGDIVVPVDPATIALTGQDIGVSISGGGVTQPLSITALPFDGYVFDSADGIVAQVTLTGLGTTGDSIQVRGASAGGNTAWTAGTTVDVAGNWMAIFNVPLAEWANWYTPEARIGTNDLTKVTSAPKFGCGHVCGIFGQSELEYTLNTNASFYSQITYPALVAENISVLTQTASGGAITRRRATDATKTQTNVAMIALANALHFRVPGRKFMILDLAEVGTSRANLMNDADDAGGNRKWSDFADMIALARSAGSEVGHIVECWYNSDAATLQDFSNEWMPFYVGQRRAGGAFTLGTVNPDSTRNPAKVIDHILWDIEAAAGVQGRGIFARARTRYHMLAPMVFHDTSNTTEQLNYSDANNRILDLDRPARDKIIEFFDDSRVQTFAGGRGPSMHVVDFNGGAHPLETDPWGICQMGRSYLPAFLRAAGVTVQEPTIIGTSTAVDGSYADVTVDLPNGGTLTTPRILNSIAAPGAPPPHHQAVMGFEIRRSGNSDGQRRPVFKSSETTYPVAYRGTVTIIDAGTGTAPNRRGRIRIVPDTPFAATGDALEFLRGEANGMLLEPRDTAAQLFLDMPIEHVPGLYDAGTLYPYQGVPVRPQPPLLALTRQNGVVVPVDPATITLTGQDIAVSISGGTITVPVDPATITLTGQDIAVSISGGDIVVPVAPAMITLTGQNIGVSITGAGSSMRGRFPSSQMSTGQVMRGKL